MTTPEFYYVGDCRALHLTKKGKCLPNVGIMMTKVYYECRDVFRPVEATGGAASTAWLNASPVVAGWRHRRLSWTYA